MKQYSLLIFSIIVAMHFCDMPPLLAQGAPDIVWEAATPSGLANSILGVGWSPAAFDRVALGSTDRWMRSREAADGSLVYSVLQPRRSGSANQTI